MQVTVRMAKVRPQLAAYPLNTTGGRTWTYPAFSAAAQARAEGRKAALSGKPKIGWDA